MMRSKLSPEHQKMLDRYGVDGTAILKDNHGNDLHVSWSESGNFIIFNPGGWGDGKFFLTHILYHFLVNEKPESLCLHETPEGCHQWIVASEMERLKQILIQRYTHKG